MPLTQQTYQSVALEDPEGQWELYRGRLREKPPMGAEHNDLAFYLGMLIQLQLDRREYRLRVNGARVRYLPQSVFIPDVAVIPVSIDQQFRGKPGTLEVYNDPVPFIAELWSATTGHYDIDTKIPEYMKRGDLEIWRLHPYERKVTRWCRQPDGTYVESVHENEVVSLCSLPDVSVDLNELFQ
jgi:Uma2 family endonuclease